MKLVMLNIPPPPSPTSMLLVVVASRGCFGLMWIYKEPRSMQFTLELNREPQQFNSVKGGMVRWEGGEGGGKGGWGGLKNGDIPCSAGGVPGTILLIYINRLKRSLASSFMKKTLGLEKSGNDFHWLMKGFECVSLLSLSIYIFFFTTQILAI